MGSVKVRKCRPQAELELSAQMVLSDSVIVRFSLICVCVGFILEGSFLMVDSAPRSSRPPG